jgi:hypothetical protein
MGIERASLLTKARLLLANNCGLNAVLRSDQDAQVVGEAAEGQQLIEEAQGATPVQGLAPPYFTSREREVARLLSLGKAARPRYPGRDPKRSVLIVSSPRVVSNAPA